MIFKHTRSLIVGLLLVSAMALGASPSPSTLKGKWKCFKEYDGAKIIGGYMDSIEFLDKEVVFNYSNGPIRCTYSVTKSYISTFNPQTKVRWKFDYKFLEGGELYLHKEPWNWRGWFTTDFNRPRTDDPADAKNISDSIRKQQMKTKEQ